MGGRIVKQKKCRCRQRPLDSERFCIKCGKTNMAFSMKAFHKYYGQAFEFGNDCRNGHQELLGAVDNGSIEHPFCADCGWKAPLPEKTKELRVS